ncbi:MAG: hypothetical protein EA352_11375 [Gemmatimonadales bacterium]|nr:MAG: hypothetical protein EA352_11375 [Gemmatimonadales bacterium]
MVALAALAPTVSYGDSVVHDSDQHESSRGVPWTSVRQAPRQRVRVSDLKPPRSGVPLSVMLHFGYESALRLVRLATPVLSRGEGKLARGLRGRDDQRGHLEGWAREHRDPGLPLVWFHAPSVGEGLQALAVARAIRRSRPEVQLAFTHFSPSARGLAESMVEAGDVDVAGYMPWDLVSETGRLLDTLSPSVVAFTKTEVWPGIVRAARRRGIPMVLVAATLPENAGRLRFPARRILRGTFGSLVRVLAISPEDGARFQFLGVRPDRVRVTGDPGVDSAVERADQAREDAPWARALADFVAEVAPEAVPGGAPPALAPESEEGGGGAPILPGVVAGSTWGPDEEVLLEGMERLGSLRPRLLVAPHEPDEAHLRPLEARLDRGGWCHARLGEVEARGSATGLDAVVVDRVGILAHLYRFLPVAFVGGGFHGQGLHSVVEPAAVGRPVLHGPRFANSLAAAELGEGGGARVVADADALARALRHWGRDPASLEAAGRAARSWVDRHRGAASRTAEALEGWL